MLKVFYAPLETIENLKAESNLPKTFLFLVISCVLAAINTFIISKSFELDTLKGAGIVLVASFVLVLIGAALFQFCMHLFTEHGGFYEALTTYTISTFIIVCGITLKSLVGLIPTESNIVSAAVSIITIVISLITYIMGFSVMIKAAMVLFDADIITVVVAVLVVYITLFLTVWSFLMQMVLSKAFAGMAGGGMPPMMPGIG